jgi:hypothetical protein
MSPPKLYTTGQAAAAVGITRVTVQKWIRKKMIRAPKLTVFANITVRMWTAADVKRLRLAKEELLYRRG